MLRTTDAETAAGDRFSPRLVLMAMLFVLVVLAAMAPASAMAGQAEGEGSSGPCTATVTSTQDPAVAAISVDCGDGNPIEEVDLNTTEDGELEEDTGTTCSNEENARNFTCKPSEPPESLLTFRFRGDSGDICADPRLTVDFEVRLENGSTENIDNVVAGNCSDESGGGDGGGGSSNDCEVEQTTTGDSGDRETGDFESRDTRGTQESDDDCAPRGGVDRGAGAAKPAGTGPGLPLAGAALLVLAVASVGVFVRRTRPTP